MQKHSLSLDGRVVSYSRRFNKSDLPTAPNWVETIFNPLNVFCEQTTNAFDKNLTFGENVQGQKYAVQFDTDIFQPIKLAYTGGGQPTSLQIGQIYKTDNSEMITKIDILDWKLNINTQPFQIIINKLSNLEAGKQYKMTLVAL
jgi:hypothetical protein